MYQSWRRSIRKRTSVCKTAVRLTTVKKVSDNLPDTDNTGDTKTVDKGGLQYLILSANALLSHENLYTKTTINTLKKV